MGQPAARVGDSTAHGGVIMPPGLPTVMIGGMPAARMGDNHMCPMATPGTPPIPHVGGPILMGSPMVLIGGAAAAKVGDTCVCTGPPDSIIAGCPTVLIGGGGGGGGGAAGGSGSAGQGKSDDGKAEENHYLDVKFVDKGGKPITGVDYSVKTPDNKESGGTVTGQVKKTGLPQGNCDIALKAITKTEWSPKRARDGEKVKMIAETAGFDPGTKAIIEVWERDLNRADKKVVTAENLAVKNDRVEGEWNYVWVEEEANPQAPKKPAGYSSPAFYFIVNIDGHQARSPILEYKDYIEIELKDGDGKPLGNVDYILRLSNGEVRKGKLDANGYKKEAKVPPGKWSVDFPGPGLVHENT
jgi:uncharacterized Zn-binding protein involved in type VI secretion